MLRGAAGSTHPAVSCAQMNRHIAFDPAPRTPWLAARDTQWERDGNRTGSSVEERIALVEEIWDSIAEATPLTEAQRRELDRRLQDHEANPDDAVSWEVVKASMAARLS